METEVFVIVYFPNDTISGKLDLVFSKAQVAMLLERNGIKKNKGEKLTYKLYHFPSFKEVTKAEVLLD